MLHFWITRLRRPASICALCLDLLFAVLVVGHGRRRLLWFEVTRHPTAEWLARQITEAFPWASAPAYLIRDNDRAYGHIFTSRVRAMGIRDRPISPGMRPTERFPCSSAGSDPAGRDRSLTALPYFGISNARTL
jgi:hypothetical protein